ncbi:DUF58 domain-containing protein [Paraglaciecola aquimarina]|uniref:DUF58 domain-containing protein n=1 Tax=Paraglaciecola algarum TaxID=3050085 RepID=A0ABS9D9P8_9ALTE|nr:DUF58 domain-containing protein [Paraglaciecola sp. G1-23]MCF2949696.1 DUF58 domain-containing protein [Paraglaciecola sp. G1-23]
MNKRIPAAQKHKLNHKNIFIFPSKFGGLFLALCVLLFLLGTNYQNNLMLLLCYFLLALFLVNLLASYINFARIELHQGKSAQVFVGDNLHLPLWLNSDVDNKHMPDGELYFKFKLDKQNKSQIKTAMTKVDVNVYTNPISLNYPCTNRGALSLPRITLSSYFPLGLFRCWTHLAFNNQIIVYPEPIPCKIHLSSHPHSVEDSSVQAGTELTGHDDFSHLKAYQAGEPLHHVAWKQVAKGRGMVSKQFSSVENQIGWLKLATNQSNENLELDISKLTFQVIELSREQQKFGLDLGNTCIAPDVGHAHTQACLTALALFPQSKA